ncbi:ATP-binding protein [Hyphomonas sp. ND6WE1B]|uniref:ATP-binding protein n=1 Tax=Hyphomonas sp. ND6WE1B TaxID=1848191 RepID=UPI001111B489|nr:ATP-binding protein [Hyphomonas sp. ND6WE1B]
MFLGMVLVALQPATGWSWSPEHWRPLDETHPAIWASLFTGLLAWLISSWVWALKPGHIPAMLFAASGFATLAFCFSSFAPWIAVPMNEETVAWIWAVNILGASAFGIIMTCLFLIYPSRLPNWKWLSVLTVFGFGSWTLLRTFGLFQDFAEVQRITTFEMLAIVIAVIWQFRSSASDPRRRAIAAWLGASTLLGAGAFIATVAAPITLGFSAFILENYAFSFFLVIYIGLAIGLMRYRLFDLGSWAYRLVFYASASIALILLDIVLVSILALDPGQALGISLLLIAIAYLPVRDFLWRRIVQRRRATDDDLFHLVLDTAFRPTEQERAAGWKTLLQDHFHPLELAEAEVAVAEPGIGREGISLPDRKDAMIRDTLADLRDVINNAQSPVLPLDEVLADLRAETAERLEPHGVSLRWSLQAEAGIRLVPSTIHTFRSLVREAASNTIKHAGAKRLDVHLRVTPHKVEVAIEDDGSGVDLATARLGQGLANMKARVEGMGGEFTLAQGTSGARLLAEFPHEVAGP